MEKFGQEKLSNHELLAILLGSGSQHHHIMDLALDLLESTQHSLKLLSSKSMEELIKIPGIGRVKASTILACTELAKRIRQEERGKVELISSSKDAYHLFSPHLENKVYEEFWILMLNRRNQVIKPYRISEGGISGTLADPKKIFKAALDHHASGIILCHNHPSGNLKPSRADLRLTARIKEGASQLDIQLLDHLIIAWEGYYSFADEGVL